MFELLLSDGSASRFSPQPLAFLLVALAGVFALGPRATEAQSPNTITQQGILTDNGGTPLDGTYDLTFQLGREVDEGTIDYFFEETLSAQVVEGRYNVQIGDGTGIPGSRWFPGSSWIPGARWFPQDIVLQTSVKGEPLEPPQQIGTTPYSFLSSGLYNQSNLVMGTQGNASLLLNNDSEGNPGDFAIFRGENDTPLFHITESPELRIPQMTFIGDVGVDGAFRAGLAGGTYAGHFQGSRSQEASDPSAHVAFVENNGGTNSDGMAILAGPDTGPGSAVNYITFYDGDRDAIGAIEGDASGGINLKPEAGTLPRSCHSRRERACRTQPSWSACVAAKPVLRPKGPVGS